MDLTGYTTPVVEYYRWYSNDRGDGGRNDFWRVDVIDLDAPVPYFVDFTRQSDYNWRRRLVRLNVIMCVPDSNPCSVKICTAADQRSAEHLGSCH